jgi:predicted  nucleic acid-binding Zn-ribbon protein
MSRTATATVFSKPVALFPQEHLLPSVDRNSSPCLWSMLADTRKGAAMSRLELAADRLAKALDALESAVLPLVAARESAVAAETKVAQLDAERETLLVRMASLEDEARSLSGLTEEVEDRLDGAIAEIRAALGR